MKKEVVFVSNFLGNGGAARVLSVLADGLAQQGYDVTMCSYSCDNYSEYERSCAVNYVTLELKHKSGIKGRLERISALRGELKKHPGATVVSFEYFVNMQAAVACFGLKNKLIVSERNDPAKMGGKFPTSALRNLLYRFCDVLVCQTPDAKAYFPKYVQKKAVIIPNPIKENLPEPFCGEREKKIVNFCRLEKQKNLPLLIDAFELFSKEHNEYTLHIYGDGREKSNIEKYIEEKNLSDKVFLSPAISNIHEAVKTFAMFVSSSDHEGLSNSMLEAMAIGLPTVCTDCPCGGARMVIEDRENGILTPVGDKDALYRAMCEVIDNDVLRNKISENALRVKESYSLDKILGEWKSIIE